MLDTLRDFIKLESASGIIIGSLVSGLAGYLVLRRKLVG